MQFFYDEKYSPVKITHTNVFWKKFFVMKMNNIIDTMTPYNEDPEPEPEVEPEVESEIKEPVVPIATIVESKLIL